MTRAELHTEKSLALWERTLDLWERSLVIAELSPDAARTAMSLVERHRTLILNEIHTKRGVS